MTAFNSKWKQEKLAVLLVVVGVCGHFAEDGYEMYKGLLNTLVELLICLLNRLFGGLFQIPSTLRRRNLKA